jgi:hypothetical protein
VTPARSCSAMWMARGVRSQSLAADDRVLHRHRPIQQRPSDPRSARAASIGCCEALARSAASVRSSTTAAACPRAAWTCPRSAAAHASPHPSWSSANRSYASSAIARAPSSVARSADARSDARRIRTW